MDNSEYHKSQDEAELNPNQRPSVLGKTRSEMARYQQQRLKRLLQQQQPNGSWRKQNDEWNPLISGWIGKFDTDDIGQSVYGTVFTLYSLVTEFADFRSQWEQAAQRATTFVIGQRPNLQSILQDLLAT